MRISDILKRSDEISSLLPNILSDSAVLTRNILQGFHHTRFPGKGEDFWQFREYKQNDIITSIDWRKSAASNKILIKEKENETSKEIYFYFDRSKSMAYKSAKSEYSKYYLSVLLVLTLSRIFLKNRESVYHFNKNKIPIKCSQDLSSFDKTFLFEEYQNNLPSTSFIKNNSTIFFISDFLYKTDLLEKFISSVKKKNTTGFLIQILDPLEITFDIKENLKLIDMETRKSFLVNDNLVFRDQYLENLKNLKKKIKKICHLQNWNYFFHDSSNPLKPTLIDIIKSIILNRGKID